MELPPDRSGVPHSARIAGYSEVSTALALIGDRQLTRLVQDAPLISSGIGGRAVLVHVRNTPVFVKRVPLTDLERRPENVMSTANIFGLPTFYHYGVSSAGSGAWRELAAHVMATNWVIEKRCESFPLMYHWRVLAEPPPRPPTPEEQANLARQVAYWHGSPAVRRRLEAIARSSASLVLFCEYIPQGLYEWLNAQATSGDAAVESACAMVEQALRTDVSFMNSNGLLHFDAHFRNILTDGQRLYFADFGLAMSSRFELSAIELDFCEKNLSHDGCYTMTQLVNWLVTTLTDAADPSDRNRLIRRYAEGDEPVEVPPQAAAVIRRYAPVAAVMNDFYWKLHTESRTTPYPVDEIRRVCTATGFDLGLHRPQRA